MGAKDERSRRDRLEATTAERLAEIIAAAERAATQVIDDAEREARREIEDARERAEELVAERLATLTAEVDALSAQANEIRHRSQELLAALSRLRNELEPGQPDGPEPRPTPEGWTGYGPKVAPRAPHLSAVAPPPEPHRDEPQPEPAPREDRDGPAGARLLATQMAISGSSREEIAQRLRNGFEIDDPEAILEAILGPEE